MAYTYRHGDRPLDGLTVQRAVGRGGFGEVYYALTDSGKQVAVKYLRDNPEIELRGVAHVMNLKSPHLITIYDVRKNAAGEPFVIMEYISGPSLRDLITAESGGMGVQKAAFLFQGMCKGLAYLHERGIVHRDLKPANIFYDDGYVKIGDYGLSKHMSVSQHSGQTVSVGTVHYMAPEIGSGSYTKAIDIYALGVILHEMLTGRLPYSGSSMAEILMKHLRDTPNLAGIPQPFASVIERALRKNPEERFQDAEEMLAAVTEDERFTRDAASFDASALTTAPRNSEPADADRTLTMSPAPPPRVTLDAREAASPGALPDRLQRKLDRLHKKLDKRSAKKGRRGAALSPAGRMREGQREARRGSAGRGDGPGRPVGIDPREFDAGARAAHWFTLIAMLVVGSAACGLLHLWRGHRQAGLLEVALPVALSQIGAVTGVMLAYFQVLARLVSRHEHVDRLIYTCAAGLASIPAAAIASDIDRELVSVTLAPLAALLLCNWTQRVEAGREGDVQLWSWALFWPALIGFAVASIMDADDFKLVAVANCVLFSMTTQMAGAAFPYLKKLEPAPLGAARGAAPPPPPDWTPGAHAASPGAAAPLYEVNDANVPPWAVAVPEQAGLAPRSVGVRLLFGLPLVMTLLVAAAGAVAAPTLQVKGDREASRRAATTALAAAACLPFFGAKTLQRYRRPLWRSTIRPLLISGGLLAAALCLPTLVGEPRAMRHTPLGVVTLIGGLIATGAFLVPGRSGVRRPAADGAVVIDAPARGSTRVIGGVALIAGLALLAAYPALHRKLDPHATQAWAGPGGASVYITQDWHGALRAAVLMPIVVGAGVLIWTGRRGGKGFIVRAIIGAAMIALSARQVLDLGGGGPVRLGPGMDVDLPLTTPLRTLIPLLALAVLGGSLLAWPSRRAAASPPAGAL